uniref:Regulatory protein zeste n=1 Tax=Heliothis virescens TaxID=7102 RepID=A0A2A4JZP3_HELVI
MDAECKRKQVNYDQLTALLEFLKEHEDLAKGLTRGRRRRGKFHTVRVWNLCAKKLNAIKNGATKDGKGWSKYWCDWKYRVRRRALELKAARDGDRPLPEGILPLSAMEENIMSLIGESAVEEVVIMNDPLSEEGLEEAIQNYTDKNEDSPINQYFDTEATEPSTSRKRRQPSNDDTAGPSSPGERKPLVDTRGNTKSSSSKRRRKQRTSINSDIELSGSSSPSESKPEVIVTKNEHSIDSDGDDKASVFLSLEREKVFGTSKIINTLEMIHSEIARLTSVMADIKDYLVTNYRQISVT